MNATCSLLPRKNEPCRTDTTTKLSSPPTSWSYSTSTPLKAPMATTKADSRPLLQRDNKRLLLKKRKVRFGTPIIYEFSSNYELHEDDDIDDDDRSTSSLQVHRRRSDRWWRREELAKNNKNAKTMKQSNINDGLDLAFQTALRIASLLSDATSERLEGHLLAMQSPLQQQSIITDITSTAEQQQGLQIWCQSDQSQRGLEKQTCRLYNLVRKRQRTNVIQKVLALSEQGADMEEIRQASEGTSRLSIIFARMLAVADSDAAVLAAASPSSAKNDDLVDVLKSTTTAASNLSVIGKGKNNNKVGAAASTAPKVLVVPRIGLKSSPSPRNLKHVLDNHACETLLSQRQQRIAI